MERALLIVSASLLVAFGAPSVFGQASNTASNDKPTTTKATATTKPTATVKVMSDASFAKIADEGGLAEVKLGQLAEDKGSSQAVKDFGKRMVTDHTQADGQLKTAASTDKITLPTQVTAREEATYDRLSKLSGAAFDRAYARDMVRDHEADIAMFQREAKYGKDTSIKSFASQTLPTLQDHLKEAQQMLQSVTTQSGSSTKKQSS